jgi:ABC-type transport system involved in multi-copper enzyme maturation permease subunit
LTLWLALLPVLTIPFLLGGVSWTEVLLSVSVNFSSICWALAAGLLASAWSKSWLRSVLVACSLAICLLAAFGMFAGEMLVSAVGFFSRPTPWQQDPDYAWLTGLMMVIGVSPGMPYIQWSFFRSPGQLLWLVALLASFSLLWLALTILIAGRRTQRVWQESSPSKARLWWQTTFCTPKFWLTFFRRWMRRKLEHNPIGWLEQRRWTGRLVTWGWLAVVISIYSAVLSDTNFFRNSSAMQNTMAWLLGGSLAMSAAASFRRERETGVMELLLVSPLGEGEIIWGRLRGLWGQFLPAFGLLLGIWAYFSTLLSYQEDAGKVFLHAISFLTLPIVGLYFSLRCRNFIAAFLATVAVGLLSPILMAAFFRFLWWAYGNPTSIASGEVPTLSFGSSLIQLTLAALCGRALYWRLKHRFFRFIRD